MGGSRKRIPSGALLSFFFGLLACRLLLLGSRLLGQHLGGEQGQRLPVRVLLKLFAGPAELFLDEQVERHVQLLILLLQLHHHLLHLGEHETDLLEAHVLGGDDGNGHRGRAFQPVNHDLDRFRLPVTLASHGYKYSRNKGLGTLLGDI